MEDNNSDATNKVENLAETHYINNCQLRFGAYDVMLSCGFAGPNKSLPIVNLIMSPHHAKIMAIILTDAVKQFEEQTGFAIPVPPEFLSPTKSV